ncbi:MAG: hypothetical protein WB297_16685 [Actinomycetota bacterium]
MNDLERDLRQVFDEDARRVPTPTSAPEGLRGSVRRRQAVFGGVIGLAGLAIVAGMIASATILLPLESKPEPAGRGQNTTGTLNGITITYPQTWRLIDPDTAGLNGSSMMAEEPLPRIVLALAPSEAPEIFGCPGATDGATAPLLMTIQEEPLALEGPSAVAWSVDLRPMSVDTSQARCYPDWEFLRAGWTASGRTFEARVGLAPSASEDERDAVFAAFASMTFEPSGNGNTSVVLAHGTAGGEDWQLVASHDGGGLSLEIAGETTGAGTAGLDASSTDIQATDIVLGSGPNAERVVFGAVPQGVVRVEALTYDALHMPLGAVVDTDVVDVPNEIDPDLNAFVLVVDPAGPVQLNGFYASGQVVATGSVGGVQPSPSADVALEDGRHFGYVRSVDPDAGTIEFDLAYFLSGEEANRAYQEATGDTGPVPNDHFVVNDSPRLRTLPLAQDLRLRLLDWNHCCETFFDGDLSLFAQAIEQQTDLTDGDLIYRGQSQWWITIENSVVTQIEEQYSP